MNPTPRHPRTQTPAGIHKTARLRAFTLVEMLAVLGIIAVVAGIAAPAVLGVINSTRMTQAGDDIAGMISQAQQIAMSESRPVEIRFYRMSDAKMVAEDASAAYRGVMLVRYFQAGEPDPSSDSGVLLDDPLAVADFGGIYRLPSGVLIADSPVLSSIMNLNESTLSASSGNTARLVVKRGGGYDTMSLPEAVAYRSFLCLPEGTDLNASDSWFVTLIDANDNRTGVTPASLKNFYTIQIEPITGRLMTYRP